jgi:hypothetical protein
VCLQRLVKELCRLRFRFLLLVKVKRWGANCDPVLALLLLPFSIWKSDRLQLHHFGDLLREDFWPSQQVS